MLRHGRFLKSEPFTVSSKWSRIPPRGAGGFSGVPEAASQMSLSGKKKRPRPKPTSPEPKGSQATRFPYRDGYLEIRRPLGQGRFGQVWEADQFSKRGDEEIVHQAKVVIKELLGDPDEATIQRELSSLQKITENPPVRRIPKFQGTVTEQVCPPSFHTDELEKSSYNGLHPRPHCRQVVQGWHIRGGGN